MRFLKVGLILLMVLPAVAAGQVSGSVESIGFGDGYLRPDSWVPMVITVEPGKRSGQPCVRGMRITVRDVLEYLAGGMTVDELLADFPELTPEDIRACLAYAADQLPRSAA